MSGLYSTIIEKYEKLFQAEQWNIGIINQPIHSFLDSDFEPDVEWLPVPRNGTFLADPFWIKKDNRLHILAEEYDYSDWKGVISVIDLTGGSSSHTTPVIEMPCHMSYPYLIEHNGEIYCVPETSEAHEVALYKAVDFPYQWTKLYVMLNGIAAVDTTIIRYNNIWWLFCTDEDDNPNETLFIWYSDSLFGPWQPHVMNPVKRNIRCSRSAGTPFLHNGSLYSPSQDCSGEYGSRIIINRVEELTPENFHEEQAAVVGPFTSGPYRCGVHTISGNNEITVIDARRKIFIWQALKMAVIQKITEKHINLY